MRTQQLALLAGSAALAAADGLMARDSDSCFAAVEEVMPKLTDAPIPDETLLSVLAEQTASVTGCDLPEVTGAMGDEYTSWLSSASEWAVEHSSEIADIWSACSDLPEVTQQLAMLPDYATSCLVSAIPEASGIIGEGGHDNSSKPDGNGNGDSDNSEDGDDSSDDSEEAGAARIAGATMVAALAAGVALVGMY